MSLEKVLFLAFGFINGDIYAFRNKAGGATAGMYKSSSSGWTEVDLGEALDFDGTTTSGEPTPGDTGTPTTLVGATSGASGDLQGISYHGLWETGAAGTMVLTNISGGPLLTMKIFRCLFLLLTQER